MKTYLIKTRIIQPPQDDLFSVFDEPGIDLQDGDVLVVSSKVVAIHQGRCIKNDGKIDKEDLVQKEADYYIPKGKENKWNLSVKYNALLLTAGIDESNSGGYFVLLPEKPNKAAREIREYLLKKFNLKKLGVIISDSHSIPFRYGTLGVSIGFYGLEPVKYFHGEKDLFDRPFQYTRINTVDALAGVGTYMMGETNEQTPLCIIRDAPHVLYSDKEHTDDLFIPPEEDIYYQLLKPLYEQEEED